MVRNFCQKVGLTERLVFILAFKHPHEAIEAYRKWKADDVLPKEVSDYIRGIRNGVPRGGSESEGSGGGSV